MPYPIDAKALAVWTAAVDASVAANPDAWNQHDAMFMETVADYNMFHAATPGFVPLDWLMVKALSWVETGPNAPEWNSNVLQIGNPGDPGLNQILNTVTGNLILPTQYKPLLTPAGVPTDPQQNIRAGVGYLLWGFAHFDYVAVPSTGGTAPPVPPKKVLGVSGWKPITLPAIAARYNGGGDGNYAGKLMHTYALASTILTSPSPSQ